jgi:putative nucleotidyltransferase with HDIG domain
MPMTIATATSVQQRGRLNNAFWRVRQFAHALHNRPDPEVDTALRQILASDAQWALLVRLTAFDRAHHLRVHALLVESGHDDPDLLLAALLHDVGKADEHGRVGPIHRAAHVLLGWLAPGLLTRVAVSGGWFGHGLWLSLHHAEHGAALARRAGASERCCALIAAHADPPQGADPLATALAAADHASIR